MTALLDIPVRKATEDGGLDSLESIPGLPKRLQIRALAGRYDNPIPTRFLAPINCSKFPAQGAHQAILREGMNLQYKSERIPPHILSEYTAKILRKFLATKLLGFAIYHSYLQ
jgi:hypothetical protein